MELFYRKAGSGPDIIILHGLFGSSDNWMSISKSLSDDFTIWAIDQRNHGQSPHSNDFDYKIMAKDLKEFIDTHEIQNPHLIGHSMGGKVVMEYANEFPNDLGKLVVADIAPKYYPPHHQSILEGLHAVNLSIVNSRKDIEDQLIPHIPEFGVRAFLMKNIYRKDDGTYAWRINLPVLTAKVNNVGDANPETLKYDGPTLFVRGQNSNYILDEDFEIIQKSFPNSEIKTISNAGHWLHAEQPEAFLKIIQNYFK